MRYKNFCTTSMTSMVVALCLTVHATPLDDRMNAFENAASPTQKDVLNILKLGVDEGRSAEALAIVQPWLNRNVLTDPAALFYAGQAAEYAGQWLPAVGYYEQFLSQPKPDAKLAGAAVDATYRLLLSVLNDESAAYLFMLKNGNDIRGYGQARRYDRWFLNQAVRRRDKVAVADRLAAIMQDRSSKPEDYAAYLSWLSNDLDNFRVESPAVYEAAAKLASINRTPEPYRARLNWVATVMPYNLQLDKLREANAPANPKLTEAPLAAAAQLIKADPNHGPLLVAAGWGATYDHIHSGNNAKRFNVEGERKFAQLLAAIPKISPDKRDDLLGYPIAQRRVKFDPLVVLELVMKYPGMLNTLDATNVPLFDKETLTVEQAKKLAPLLARNPHADAALIRAIASSGSLEYSKIAEAMMKNEAWRFNDAKSVIETAWRNSTVQDKQYKEVANLYPSLGDQYDKLKKQVSQQASSQQRLAAFKTLRDDLLSKSPSIPGALSLWRELFKNVRDADTIAMLQGLVAADDAEKTALLEHALANLNTGKGQRLYYEDTLRDHYLHNANQRTRYVKRLAPLVRDLENILKQQAKAGTFTPALFGLWLHGVDPADKNAREMMASLRDTKAYANLPRVYRQTARDRYHFGNVALTSNEIKNTSAYVSESLMKLPKNANARQVEQALAEAIKRAQAADTPVTIVRLQPVAALPTWNDGTRRQVMSLFKDNAPMGDYPRHEGYRELAERILKETREAKRWGDLEPYIAGMWTAASTPDNHTYFSIGRNLVALSQDALEDEATSAALALATSGKNSRASRQMAARNSHNLPQIVANLNQVQGKASIALGIIDIPVDEQDPAFPIYKSQAEFALGNTAAAWDLYKANADTFLENIRSLTVPYCLWILEQNLADDETDRAQSIIRELTVWSRQESGRFTPQQEGELKIAYADTAFQKGALQTARAWYRRVADADEYKGTELQYEAALKSVDVDRAEKNFGSAMAELDNLMRIRDENLRMRVHFARAQVLFDQENYAEAFNEVSTVLKRNPNHPDALILLGEAQLEMRKLIDAAEIELGFSQDQKLIVPGETIKINLTDPALNISGVGADIEIEIWSKSGDRERVKLHQLGDDKTKFRAEVPTRLAKRQTGDKVLQVLGRDEIRYGYSKRFRDKMTDLPPDPDVVIEVASDARLSASAGAFPPREGERKLDLAELGVSSAQQALGTRSVRPGNPIYLRVNDLDQSKTDEIDEVFVSITTSTGDTIPHIALKETGPHTGEFQTTINTGQAQAMAFASESAPGRDPNMTISASPYPGWAGEVGSKKATQTLTIDLNDDVKLGLMTIACTESSQMPTRFLIQTSMNGQTWRNVARFPDNTPTWIGQPLSRAFPTYGRNAQGVSKPEGFDLPADWQQSMDIATLRSNVNFAAHNPAKFSEMSRNLPSGGHPGYSVLLHYRAYFYQAAAEIRTFKLTGFPADLNTKFLIDGKPASPDSESPLTIQRELKPGLHTIDIWRNGSRNELEKRKPQLLMNVEGKSELVPCPDSMFDPTTFPKMVRDALPMQTKITNSARKPNAFDVAFGMQTHARMVRLVIVEHEGAAPAIHKITLTDREGETRLPVATDYQELRNNDKLEVIPGDSISIRYEDDRTATPNAGVKQGRLSVAFNTATIDASYLNYEMTETGRELQLEAIRRFKLGDSVGIVITDPDMDQTHERDTLKFMAHGGDSQPVMLDAIETEPHSGVFIGNVFPVEGSPTRASEIQIKPGGTLTASYLDQENLDPGIPTRRSVVLEHALFSQPQLAVYDMDSTALPKREKSQSDQDEDERGPEIVEPKRSLSYSYPDATQPHDPSVVIGGTLRFDVLARHLAFSRSSEVNAYVQTESGRAMHRANGKADTSKPYDVDVPGTMKLDTVPSRSQSVIAPAGYVLNGSPVAPTNRPALDEGRFAFAVDVALGNTPQRSFGNEEAETLSRSMFPEALAVRPGDKVHIGFEFTDPDGNKQWITETVDLDSHAFLDVMNDRFRRDVDAAYVGEKLYIRLIAPDLDKTADRDRASVQLKTENGITVNYPLRESDFHSGVFKGSFSLGYLDRPVEGPLPSVLLHGLPVKYGDQVHVSYNTTQADAPAPRSVRVNKGADGNVEPFTKQYGEDAVAVQTTFTLAECYFELAKHHRKMEQESLARRQMAHAQKLLAEAIAQHRDDSLKAHAEYLLGNLAQEYADLSNNDIAKTRMYQDALGRFAKIPLDYPETEFAPKAQFKKGLVYEKLGELDIAVEEYVKLAYKYPEHELIPSVMSRLGSYFQAQGKAYKDEAERLEKQTGNAEAQGEAIRLRKLATREYLDAAQVFAKLQDRFPNNALAGLAGLRSAQNFMRAADYTPAIAGFQKVIDNETYDDRLIRSQAMFWQGISYERINELRKAYQTYRRVTFDFPDSIWAKQSRGRLADPAFARIIAEEELARQRMLDQLKEQKKRR